MHTTEIIGALSPEEIELLVTLLGRLMNQPAAPYHETMVHQEVLKVIQEFDLTAEVDEYGTTWVGLNGTRFPNTINHSASNAVESSGEEIPPSDLILAAHLDHPGFEFIEWNEEKQLWKCRFLGGVGAQYFQHGTQLKIMPGGHRGWLESEFEVEVEVESDPSPGKKKTEKFYWVNAPEATPGEAMFGVWDLDAFRMDGDNIHGRACDDLVGVASALATLILVQKRFSQLENSSDADSSQPRPAVWAMLSRAEEVGFQGALVSMDRIHSCANPWVISLEASKEIAGVRQGDGVILRVGDRSSVFDSKATLYLRDRAEKLEGSQNDFSYQMAWMGGGSCEGTAFQSRGIRTGALCVPLRNYHNQGSDDRIEAESIHLRDARTMTELLIQSAWDLPQFFDPTRRLAERMDKLRDEGLTRLKKS